LPPHAPVHAKAISMLLTREGDEIMNWKKTIAIGLIVLHFPFVSACMKTVTQYTTKLVPVTVTKYRTVQKPVEKEVQVPYQEEVRTPQYKTIRNPKLKPSEGQTMTLAFLPFSSSTGNPADGAEVSRLLKNAVQRHAESPERYAIVGSDQIRNAFGGNDVIKITPEDIRKLNTSLGVETVVTGHVKSRDESNLSFRVEGIAARSMRLLFGETIVGESLKAVQQALEIFYGKKALLGYKTESVTKTRTENQTFYEAVQEAYEDTEYQNKSVEDGTISEIDWSQTLGGLLLIGLVVLLTPSSDKKK
jgi:hypothetical protein